MKRPEEHVTGDKGVTQVRASFETFGWTVEPVTKDYGRDLNVEVFANGETTGIIFRIQVRSSESTAYSKDGTYVSESISRENAKYWAEELRSPLVLIHADVRAGRNFWTLPQLDNSVLTFLEHNDPESITVRIPTSNQLSSAEQLLESLAQAETVLAARAITSTTVPGFLKAIEGRMNRDEVFSALKNKTDALGIERAEERIKSGSLDQVVADMERAINDTQTAVENRFWAVLVLERAEVVKASQAGQMAEVPKIQMHISELLRRVSRRGPHHLKFYSLIAKLASQLHLLTSRAFMLYLNEKVNSGSQVDKFWRSVLSIERARLTRAVVHKFEQCLRVITYALNSDYLGALPHAMNRVIMGISPFIHQLLEEDPKGADAYVKSTFAIGRLAADVAVLTGDEDTAGWVVGHMAWVVPGGTAEISSWAEVILDKIKNKERRAYFAQNVREALGVTQQVQGNLTIAEEQEIYRRMAEAQGVNLADQADRIARIVNIGIADFDPTRVLKNCQHFFVTIASTGKPGEWLGLPTAGFKNLHCTLKRKSIAGVSLDGIYASFKSTHCKGCEDCLPHAPGWSYTHEWQRGQNEINKDFIRSVEKD